MNFILFILALAAGSVGSVGLAGLMLLLDDARLEKLATSLLYLAGGTLLGAAFLGMLPKSIQLMGVQNVMSAVLIGIVFFFLLEKLILWRSCQNKNCDRHTHAAVPIILIGDAFHNAIDGVVIAAAFLTSVELGLFVTLSVMMHEVPQELADFGVLLRGGYSRSKALLLNMLSGSSAMVFGLLAWFALEAMRPLIPWALAFSAASFIYISLADLIPEMHRKTQLKDSAWQLFLIIIGISIIYLILQTK